MRFAGGLNRYAYVGNDPVNRTDPTGMDFWDLLMCLSSGYNPKQCILDEWYGRLALLRHFLYRYEDAHGSRAVGTGDRRNQPASNHSAHRGQRERHVGLVAPYDFFSRNRRC